MGRQHQSFRLPDQATRCGAAAAMDQRHVAKVMMLCLSMAMRATIDWGLLWRS
jgi:hypothetical protein